MAKLVSISWRFFAVVACFILFSFSVALATNGDNMIGITPASEAMGGIGVGMPVGSIDSIFRNPAWMNTEEGFTASFGGIVFLPEVKARYKDPFVGDSGYITSKSKLFLVPELGITYRLGRQTVFGIAAYGVSGMGVDYRNKDRRLVNMHTQLMLMRIIPAISYQIDNFVIGAGLDLVWGSLNMNARMTDPMTGTSWNAGGGQSSSYGIGGRLGLGYHIGDLYFGMVYQIPTALNYKGVFDTDNDNDFENLKLYQPQEFAFGAGYKLMPNLKVGADIRWINWSSAKGYKEFQWKDQWIFALGAEYQATEKLKLRIGYNYGKTPIRGKSNLSITNSNRIPDFKTRFSDFQVAWFNLIGFPAITEHHISLGGSYNFTKNFSLDIAYVHAFGKTVESSAMNGAFLAGAKNSQNEIGLAFRWSF